MRMAMTLWMCLFTFLASSAFSQTYPAWFLEQGRVPGETVVGYARAGVHPDSSLAQAFRNACENGARHDMVRVSGRREHWATELGTTVMENSMTEEFDSARTAARTDAMRLKASAVIGEMVLALVGPGTELLPEPTAVRDVRRAELPPWVSTIPADGGYIYAVGMAPEYFYEMSSWLEAERNGRKNLALAGLTDVKSLQLAAEQTVQKSREEVSVVLSSVAVVARWRDVKNKIIYALVRMPKQ